MTASRWSTIERLYHEALGRSAGDRAAFLNDACGRDDALRHEVESLLAHDGDASFLSTPAARSVDGRPLHIGQTLGSYVILARLGEGGMGEVYRARDTTLGRDVAIKVLPAIFASDPERLARFKREARMLAALNHPHLGAIYGVAESDGIPALVLELVEGPTLAETLALSKDRALPPSGVVGAARSGRLMPLGDALAIARQIAEALEAAHEKGIVHRDLKPANIKITPAGVVKVLDFGLAKAPAGDGSALNLSQLPTVTVGGTREGVILGTAAYMSPEQARGQAVDKRTDIWAFGCVLYEMLTGRAAFAGATFTDTLAAILERPPDWSALPASTPASLRRLLARCLEKDAIRRLRDIGDARLDLDGTSVAEPTTSIQPATAARRTGGEYVAWSVAALLLIVLGAIILFRSHPDQTPPAPSIVRTTIVLPPDQKLTSASGDYPFAMSPDGRRLAYVVEQGGDTQLYVRELRDLAPKAMTGTSGARHPFFSPDGQWVGFFANGTLQRVSIEGGAPLRVCNVPAVSMGGSWGPDNTIVFASRGVGLSKIGVAGGIPQPLKGSDPASWPEILPDARTVLFTTGVGAASSAIATMSLDGGEKRVLARTSDSPLQGPAVIGTGGGIVEARFLPSGHIGVGQSPGIVRAIPFNLASLTVSGSAVSLIDSLERGRNGGAVYFAVSKTGLMVYASTGDPHQLVWVDRKGTETPLSPDRAAFRLPRTSPDGKWVAVAVNDETRRSDIWIYDAERGTKRRLTSEGHNLEPVWTPTGASITFSGSDGIVELAPDGSGRREVLLSSRDRRYPSSWSPDGNNLLFSAQEVTGYDLGVLTHGSDGVSRPLLVRPFNDADGQFSRDGRWVSYVSDDSGRDEVYVGRFPLLGDKVTVSTNGGARPRWSPDGHELFYRQGDALMAVTVDTSRGFRAEKPRRLFSGQYSGEGHELAFDVAPDGRFLMVKSDEASTLRQLTVVQNWTEELKRLVHPAAGPSRHGS